MSEQKAMGCLILGLFGVLIFVVGLFAGIIIATSNPQMVGGPDSGIPINGLVMSDDGTTLNFYIQEEAVQVILTQPTDRPPNLNLATKVFVYNNYIVFIDAEGNRIFRVAIQYQNIQYLEG